MIPFAAAPPWPPWTSSTSPPAPAAAPVLAPSPETRRTRCRIMWSTCCSSWWRRRAVRLEPWAPSWSSWWWRTWWSACSCGASAGSSRMTWSWSSWRCTRCWWARRGSRCCTTSPSCGRSWCCCRPARAQRRRRWRPSWCCCSTSCAACWRRTLRFWSCSSTPARTREPPTSSSSPCSSPSSTERAQWASRPETHCCSSCRCRQRTSEWPDTWQRIPTSVRSVPHDELPFLLPFSCRCSPVVW